MKEQDNHIIDELGIAVIGMAGRFPGAQNVSQFLENLKNGVEAISFLSDDELREAGVEPELWNSPDYVKAKGILEDVEYFDATFFKYTPREAKVMCPQVRLFHEHAWEVLEEAGLVPDSYDGQIGIYAGANSSILWEILCELSGEISEIGAFAATQLTYKDYISSRTSYKLNLTGPIVSIHTACSTSLVAIHMACQGILNGECDIALAGGVCITLPLKNGYLYKEGMIDSPEGHVRAFDAEANGTVFGDGIGVVLLKRLEYAVAEHDNIYAIIKGSAINNDGNRKVGFPAPSVEGQEEVLRTAIQVAGVEPETITYIETHGTGTSLGDPIEFEALKKAFNTDKKQFCALGAVKSSVGHLDTAAGVAGFIKTVLSLKHKLIFPSINYRKNNPKIDMENSPFYINTRLTEWKTSRHPLRAGVSGMGVGGTNAHLILEETPEPFKLKDSPLSRSHKLVMLSAKTPAALDRATENLATFLEKNRNTNLADVAYTLQVGRKVFKHRRVLLCAGINGAVEALSSPGSPEVQTRVAKEGQPAVIFMFPGQGSQYRNMGLGIYQEEKVFRQEMDRCFDILTPLLGVSVKDLLYPGNLETKGHNDINQTGIAQPLIFIFEYALARLLMSWGIVPHAMIGHSIGEYVAACLAGVISLEDALRLVAKRARLMQQMNPGSMLAVSGSEEKLNPLLKEEISLAAVNSPSNCVVSGSSESIAAFEKQLMEKGYHCRRLQTSHAFHSKMMDPILDEFEQEVRKIRLTNPKTPYISNLTGAFITSPEAVNPRYWVKHLRDTVRFSAGIATLLKEENSLFLEVGPGNVLSSMVNKHPTQKSGQRAFNLVRHPKESLADTAYLLSKVGYLWLHGVELDWTGFYARELRNRMALPSYPFERQRYWIQGNISRSRLRAISEDSPLDKKSHISEWFYTPLWKKSIIPSLEKRDTHAKSTWLVFSDEEGLGEQLVKKLETEKPEDQLVIIVRKGNRFVKINQREYMMNPGQSKDYETILRQCQRMELVPDQIIHLWGISREKDKLSDPEHLSRSLDSGFYSILELVRVLGKLNVSKTLNLCVVTNNMQEVIGEKRIYPEKSVVLGAVKVILREYPNIRCRSVDIDLPESGKWQDMNLLEQLVADFESDSRDEVIAYRGNHRWIQIFEPLQLEKTAEGIPLLREKGIYMITGGLGGIGFVFAEYLAKAFQARLILTGRTALPTRDERDHWLKRNECDEKDQVGQKIRKIQELEALGAQVLYFDADAANQRQMRDVITRAEERFGYINGILHAAGVADYGGVIQRRTREMTERILAPKVRGTLVLHHIMKDRPMDFLVLFSSLSSIVAPFGQVGFAAASAFLDVFAHYRNVNGGGFTVSINWGNWQEVGMAVEAVKHLVESRSSINSQDLLKDGISPVEGIEAFNRVLKVKLPQIAVSTQDLKLILKQRNDIGASLWNGEFPEASFPQVLSRRPELTTPYAEPGKRVEKIVVEILQAFLQIEQIGIHDNFFELGLTSLDLVQVNGKLHKALGNRNPVALLFEYPTVHSLSKYLEQNQGEACNPDDEPERKENLDQIKNKLKRLSSQSKRL